jgi:hypothetical protein
MEDGTGETLSATAHRRSWRDRADRTHVHPGGLLVEHGQLAIGNDGSDRRRFGVNRTKQRTA